MLFGYTQLFILTYNVPFPELVYPGVALNNIKQRSFIWDAKRVIKRKKNAQITLIIKIKARYLPSEPASFSSFLQNVFSLEYEWIEGICYCIDKREPNLQGFGVD